MKTPFLNWSEQTAADALQALLAPGATATVERIEAFLRRAASLSASGLRRVVRFGLPDLDTSDGPDALLCALARHLEARVVFTTQPAPLEDPRRVRIPMASFASDPAAVCGMPFLSRAVGKAVLYSRWDEAADLLSEGVWQVAFLAWEGEVPPAGRQLARQQALLSRRALRRIRQADHAPENAAERTAQLASRLPDLLAAQRQLRASQPVPTP